MMIIMNLYDMCIETIREKFENFNIDMAPFNELPKTIKNDIKCYICDECGKKKFKVYKLKSYNGNDSEDNDWLMCESCIGSKTCFNCYSDEDICRERRLIIKSGRSKFYEYSCEDCEPERCDECGEFFDDLRNEMLCENCIYDTDFEDDTD